MAEYQLKTGKKEIILCFLISFQLLLEFCHFGRGEIDYEKENTTEVEITNLNNMIGLNQDIIKGLTLDHERTVFLKENVIKLYF